MALATRDDDKSRRNFLLMLLSLLTGRRASSIVRVWDHPSCLTVDIKRLDAPDWARTHRTEAATILHELGRSPRSSLSDGEFVVMRMRAHLSKTCLASGQRHDPWISLTENRFEPRLCPALALGRYLLALKGAKITKELRCDSTTLVNAIVDDRGNEHVASPLLVSLNGRPRTGPQPSTLNSRVREMSLFDSGARPHITRATVASYREAYGESVSAVLALGAWRSEEAFKKHYFRLAQPPISPSRLLDVPVHDWRLTRAHQFCRMANLPPLPGHRRVAPDTRNDEAIARSLDGMAKKRRLRPRR